ncbi:MAG: serine/threonine-protein kinase, partial [Verrucomicrobiales bacterium]|nr:serine/threonine-protein kinase [Verrucomicrobiales bacterium]
MSETDDRQSIETSGDSGIPEDFDPVAAFRFAAADSDERAVSSSPPGNAAWEPPTVDELNEQLPSFEVEQLLGRGGMGAVFRARQLNLDRTVAIKILPPVFAGDEAFAKRFEREAKSLAKLNHPNIVQIYDFDRSEAGFYFFVMEYVDGTDFHHLIRSGELDPARALQAVSQICDALAYSHEQGFIHRDIKPANIFLNSQGMVKVGDFGLAKIVGQEKNEELTQTSIDLTKTGAGMGTLFYSAPEQLSGSGDVDHRADIFSLGISLYEMLTGHLPRGAFELPSKKLQLDVRVDEVVLRAIADKPEHRYQSAPDLRIDVDDIREKLSSKANESESSPEKDLFWNRAKKVVFIVAAIIAVLGLFVGGFRMREPKNGRNQFTLDLRVENDAPPKIAAGNGAESGSPFPLPLPAVPTREEKTKCRLVIVNFPGHAGAPPPWAKAVREDDFTDLIEIWLR